MTVMRTVEDYRKRAQEAMELAQTARPSERPTLLEIAQIWLKLADERQAALDLEAGAAAKKPE
jgi:hypothetical protein